MFFWRRPDAARLEEIRRRAAQAEFNYPEVGETKHACPPGYLLDHNRAQLGAGHDAFQQACEELRRWRAMRLGWIEPCWPDAPLKLNEVIGTITRCGPVWAVNPCRVVYLIDESEPSRRFGFAQGTLIGHEERGEERFLVEQLPDGGVWFDLLAFSRPQTPLARLGKPLVRSLQKRFARDALLAMQRAVGGR